MSQIRSGQFTFRAEQYASSPLRYDRVLARARASGESVHCLCRPEPRPLVIRQLRGHHFLAVWPLDGERHAPWCHFYRNADDDVRQQDRLARAGLTDDLEGHSVPVARPALSLPRPPRGSGSAPGTAEVFDPVELPALLGQLWSLSGLQRWMTGWSRDWKRVQRSLRTTARRLTVHGNALDEILYVTDAPVEPDAGNGRDGGRAKGGPGDWPRIVEDLRRSRRRRLVLGLLRSVGSTPYGWRLDLAGLPLPVFVSNKAGEGLERECERLATTFAQDGAAGAAGHGQWLAFLDVRVSPSGNVSAVDACVVQASGRYFLCEGDEDAVLADQLAAQDRAFTKRVPPACRPAEPVALADLQLHDTDSEWGSALVLLRRDAAVPRAAVAEFVLGQLAGGRQVWVWDASASSEPPPLPGVGAELGACPDRLHVHCAPTGPASPASD